MTARFVNKWLNVAMAAACMAVMALVVALSLPPAKAQTGQNDVIYVIGQHEYWKIPSYCGNAICYSLHEANTESMEALTESIEQTYQASIEEVQSTPEDVFRYLCAQQVLVDLNSQMPTSAEIGYVGNGCGQHQSTLSNTYYICSYEDGERIGQITVRRLTGSPMRYDGGIDSRSGHSARASGDCANQGFPNI